MLYRLAWLFFMSATLMSAQQKADCLKMSSLGCHSFNELLDAQDADILTAVNSEFKTSRVCFVEGEDNFVVLTVGLPPTDWRKDKSGFYSILRAATFSRYKDGVSDQHFRLPVTWRKFSEDDDPMASGSTRLPAESSLAITADETVFSSKWANKGGTITTFDFTIRLATGRFKGSYSWKDAKGKFYSVEETGHCVRYQGGTHE